MPHEHSNGELTPAVAQDATEAALVSLLERSMSENTAATKAGFDRMSEGMHAMAKEVRSVLYALVSVLGLGFLLMVAIVGSIAGAGVYLKSAGVEVHTAVSAAP